MSQKYRFFDLTTSCCPTLKRRLHVRCLSLTVQLIRHRQFCFQGFLMLPQVGHICVGFLTQCMPLFGCQDSDPVSAFRVCLVHQAITQREGVCLLVCFPSPNIPLTFSQDMGNIGSLSSYSFYLPMILVVHYVLVSPPVLNLHFAGEGSRL